MAIRPAMAPVASLVLAILMAAVGGVAVIDPPEEETLSTAVTVPEADTLYLNPPAIVATTDTCTGTADGDYDVSDIVPGVGPISLTVSCAGGTATCDGGQGDIHSLGQVFPYGAGFASSDEKNTIYQVFLFCITDDPDGQGMYTTFVNYQAAQTGKSKGSCSSDWCRLGPNHDTETVAWELTRGGRIVDWTPFQSFDHGGSSTTTTTESHGVTVGGLSSSAGITWAQTDYEFYTDREDLTGVTATFAGGTNVKRNDYGTTYGIAISHPLDALCMDYTHDTRFHHEINWSPDHHHTYTVEGAMCVLGGRLYAPDSQLAELPVGIGKCDGLRRVQAYVLPERTGGCLAFDISVPDLSALRFDDGSLVTKAISSLYVKAGCEVNLRDGNGHSYAADSGGNGGSNRDLTGAGFSNVATALEIVDESC